MVTLYAIAALLITLNFAIFYFWLQYQGPLVTMRGFYELNSYHIKWVKLPFDYHEWRLKFDDASSTLIFLTTNNLLKFHQNK